MITLIDAYSIFFRAYYAMPPMVREGKNINAVFGFLRNICNIINVHQPEYLVVVLDAGGETFRTKMQHEYLLKKEIKALIEKHYEEVLSVLSIEEIEKLKNLEISTEELKNKFKIQYDEDCNQGVILALFLGYEFEAIEDKAGYKANRKELEPDFIEQFAILDEMLLSLGISTQREKGLEADDIISSIAIEESKNNDVLIVSSDKDIMQLVGGRVSFFDLSSKKIMKSEDVRLKFGVSPDLIPDFLALTGDASDNIPGIKGVGGVTAAKIINKYGCIEDIFKNIEAIDDPKIKAMMEQHKEQVKFAKSMTILKKIKHYDVEKMNFNLNGFNDFVKKYQLYIKAPALPERKEGLF